MYLHIAHCKQTKDSKRTEPKQHKLLYFVLLKTSGFPYTAIGFAPSCRLPRWCRLQEFSHCPRQLQQSSPKLSEVSWAVIHEAMGTTPYHNIYMHMTSYSIRLCNLTVLEWNHYIMSTYDDDMIYVWYMITIKLPLNVVFGGTYHPSCWAWAEVQQQVPGHRSRRWPRFHQLEGDLAALPWWLVY